MDKRMGKVSFKLVLLIIVVFLIIFYLIIPSYFNKNRVHTETTSQLKSVIDKSNLYSVVYFGNFIKEVKENDKIIYYINYKGTIYGSIDIKNVDINKGNKKGEYIITYPNKPKVEDEDFIVDISDIDILFKDDSKNDEKIHEKAYHEALEDLKNKVNDEKFLNDYHESTENTLKALLEPLIKTNDYSLSFQTKEGDNNE